MPVYLCDNGSRGALNERPHPTGHLMPRSAAYIKGWDAAARPAYTACPFDPATDEAGDWADGYAARRANDARKPGTLNVTFSFRGSPKDRDEVDALLKKNGGPYANKSAALLALMRDGLGLQRERNGPQPLTWEPGYRCHSYMHGHDLLGRVVLSEHGVSPIVYMWCVGEKSGEEGLLSVAKRCVRAEVAARAA